MVQQEIANHNTTSAGMWRMTSLLRSLLLSDESVRELVGDNIFPCVAGRDTAGDFVLIQRDEYKREQASVGFDLVNIDEVVVSLGIFSTHYDRSVQIAEAIDGAISRMGHICSCPLGQCQCTHHAVGDIDHQPSVSIQLVDSSESHTELDKYMQTLVYRIS